MSSCLVGVYKVVLVAVDRRQRNCDLRFDT